MRKSSKRDTLIKDVQKRIERADKPTLTKVCDDLAGGAAFDDERDAVLLAMADAGIESQVLRPEQLRLMATRDAKRAAQLEGVATRIALDATLDLFDPTLTVSDAAKDVARTEHRAAGSAA